MVFTCVIVRHLLVDIMQNESTVIHLLAQNQIAVKRLLYNCWKAGTDKLNYLRAHVVWPCQNSDRLHIKNPFPFTCLKYISVNLSIQGCLKACPWCENVLNTMRLMTGGMYEGGFKMGLTLLLKYCWKDPSLSSPRPDIRAKANRGPVMLQWTILWSIIYPSHINDGVVILRVTE